MQELQIRGIGLISFAQFLIMLQKTCCDQLLNSCGTSNESKTALLQVNRISHLRVLKSHFLNRLYECTRRAIALLLALVQSFKEYHHPPPHSVTFIIFL